MFISYIALLQLQYQIIMPYITQVINESVTLQYSDRSCKSIITVIKYPYT